MFRFDKSNYYPVVLLFYTISYIFLINSFDMFIPVWYTCITPPILVFPTGDMLRFDKSNYSPAVLLFYNISYISLLNSFDMFIPVW